MSPRNQVRRLSHVGADRERRHPTPDPRGPRLDRQISRHSRRSCEAQSGIPYLDGELCGVRPDGVSSFELMQQASERGGAALVYFAFDLLEIEGENLMVLPFSERKSRLASLLTKPPNGDQIQRS
jgi:hypothetical protein